MTGRRQYRSPHREDLAYLTLERLRWGDEPTCAHCDSTEHVVFFEPRDERGRRDARGHWSRRRVWKCYDCGAQFTVTVGTVMHGSHLPLWIWLDLARRVQSEDGLPTPRSLVSAYGISERTAYRLRDLVVGDLDAEGSLLGAYALETAVRA